MYKVCIFFISRHTVRVVQISLFRILSVAIGDSVALHKPLTRQSNGSGEVFLVDGYDNPIQCDREDLLEQPGTF
jgi:hypothetical protein